jgi:hypothetical protein
MTQEESHIEKKLFRFNRGSFQDSMKTVIEFKDKSDLLSRISVYNPIIETEESLECIPYFGVDNRNGWNTYLIKLGGFVVGMTNCKI